MSAGFVEITDEAKAYLWTVAAAAEATARERRDAYVELAMAGELDWDPLRDRDMPAPWTVRPEAGRWP